MKGIKKDRSKPAWNKGLKTGPMSTETRSKMSASRTGSKNPSWKGGVVKNKQHQKNNYKEWVSKNRDRKLIINNRRRVRKLNNGGLHTLEEWKTMKAQYNNSCPSCKRFEAEIKLTRDHIVPLSKGGTDNLENIQPLCKSCNSKKYNKVISKYTI